VQTLRRYPPRLITAIIGTVNGAQCVFDNLKTKTKDIMKTVTIKPQGEPKSVSDMTPYELALEQQKGQKFDAEWFEDFLDAHDNTDCTD